MPRGCRRGNDHRPRWSSGSKRLFAVNCHSHADPVVRRRRSAAFDRQHVDGLETSRTALSRVTVRSSTVRRAPPPGETYSSSRVTSGGDTAPFRYSDMRFICWLWDAQGSGCESRRFRRVGFRSERMERAPTEDTRHRSHTTALTGGRGTADPYGRRGRLECWSRRPQDSVRTESGTPPQPTGFASGARCGIRSSDVPVRASGRWRAKRPVRGTRETGGTRQSSRLSELRPWESS